jgi:hypothetical protein
MEYQARRSDISLAKIEKIYLFNIAYENKGK